MIVCPENRSSLGVADDGLLADLNRAIDGRRLKNKGGDVLEKTLDAALVRQDRAIAYPIIDGIPILLVDEGILLNQLSGS